MHVCLSVLFHLVIPAKAGTQALQAFDLGPRFRGDDEFEAGPIHG